MLAATHDEACGQVFNVGGAEAPVTLKDLADLMVQMNGGGDYALREFPAERKQIDIGDYFADDRRIRKAFGWQPRVGLSEGLARTLGFYRENLRHYV